MTDLSDENILKAKSTYRNQQIEWDYEEVLRKIGYGKCQLLLLLISGLLTITSISAQQSVGIIAIASQCEFRSSQSDKGLMMAACVAGIFLSTYIWGHVSDALGRRIVLLYGAFVSSFLQIVLVFVTNLWIFNIINLLIGISLGGVSAAIYAYLSEFHIQKHRAVVINCSTMFVSIAAIYVPATAWLALSAELPENIVNIWNIRPWRLIMVLNMLPGLIGGLLLLLYPESPKLLLAQNNESSAISALAWISTFNTGKTIEKVLGCDHITLKPEVEHDTLRPDQRTEKLSDIVRATIPLFFRPHGSYFIISNIAIFNMFFSSNGMQYWLPEIINRVSQASTENEQTVCNILDSSFSSGNLEATQNSTLRTCDDSISTKTFVDNMVVGLAFLIGFTIQGMLLNPFGRKRVLIASLLLSTLCGLMLHFATNSTILLIFFCLYIILPGLAISIMLGAVVDLIPTHLRGKAVSLCMTLGRLGIIIAAYLIGVLLQPYCNSTFAIFTLSMFICIPLVYYLPIKNSK